MDMDNIFIIGRYLYIVSGCLSTDSAFICCLVKVTLWNCSSTDINNDFEKNLKYILFDYPVNIKESYRLQIQISTYLKKYL